MAVIDRRRPHAGIAHGLTHRWTDLTGLLDSIPPSVWLVVLVPLAALVVIETAILLRLVTTPASGWQLGQDYAFYRDIGARWLREGTYYLPQQLAGPYELSVMEDVLYPPIALPLFVLLSFVPAITWWAIPSAVVTIAIARWRPARWAVVMALLLLAWPRAIGYVLFGNTDLLAMAAVTGGLLWGWPAALVVLKPSLLPFAFIGAERPRWRLGVALVVALSVVTLPLWPDYVRAMRDLHIGWDYALGSVPLLLVPVALWIGRRDRPGSRRDVPAPRRPDESTQAVTA